MLTTICFGCRKPIDEPFEAVCVTVWSQIRHRYEYEGPFHSECGKAYAIQEEEKLNLRTDKR